MPALMPTNYTGTITWLGLVAHRNKPELEGTAATELDLTFEGIPGSTHGGLTRPSCSRVTSQYERGTPIKNTRQLSIISAEELEGIARDLGLDDIDPAMLGASIVIRGIPDFSHVPPSSRLQASSGATITVDMENRPCQFPAMTIEKAEPGHGKGFRTAAVNRRGVTGWVEREGVLRVGDNVTLHIPDQKAWQPA